MQHTLFTILTNAQTRSASSLAVLVQQNLTAGAPWFDKTSDTVLLP